MKKLVGSSAVALAGLVLFSGVALAATDTVVPKDASNLTIEFTGSENPNTPTGPFADHLSFTWAPREFAFGKQTADLTNAASYELKSADAGKQYVVVNDDRKAASDVNAGMGWNVKVEMAPITQVVEPGEAAETISGKLSLNMARIKNYDMGTKVATDPVTGIVDVVPNDPNTKDVVSDFQVEPTDIYLGSTGSGLGSTTDNVLTIEPGEETSIMGQTGNRAGNDRKVMGYASNIKSASIQFTDLGASAIGKQYASKLTWTLTREIN